MVEIIEAGMQFIVGWQQGRVGRDRLIGPMKTARFYSFQTNLYPTFLNELVEKGPHLDSA
jgi:hypothetical protein